MDKTTPVACTLTPVELAAQGERWHRLIARAMTERAETSDGLRICFRPEAEEELRALAPGDGCCPWATWTVSRTPATIVLDVRSTAEGVATLHGMFGRHQPGKRGHHWSRAPIWSTLRWKVRSYPWPRAPKNSRPVTATPPSPGGTPGGGRTGHQVGRR